MLKPLTAIAAGMLLTMGGCATPEDEGRPANDAIASNSAANGSPNGTFRPGPKQLTITTANINGGVSSVNGITLHVLGTNGTNANAVTYNPTVVNVAGATQVLRTGDRVRVDGDRGVVERVRRGHPGQPAGTGGRRLQRERRRLEAAEDPGAGRGRHHRRPRAPGP